MAKQPRLGLVIGSGGLKCAAAIGVMQVLEAEHILLDLVVGCSGGSIFGAAIAMGLPANEMVHLLAQTWTREATQMLDVRSLAKIALPKLAGFDDDIGILNDRGLLAGLVQTFGAEATVQETKLPFRCIATDFHTGDQVVLAEGNLVKAIRASSGIPIMLKPVEWDGRLLIDGGLSDPLPIDVAIQEGVDVIIAVGFETPLAHSVESPLGFASQLFNILSNQLLYRKFAFYNLAYHSEIIAIVPQFDREIGLGDVDIIPFIIERGRDETLKHIAHIKRALASQNTQNLRG